MKSELFLDKNTSQNKAESFHEQFPNGRIEEIFEGGIPKATMDFFEGMNRRFILPEEYKPRNFEKFYVITYGNGDKTYVAEQLKEYSREKGPTEKEKNVYFFDTRGKNKIGHGELRLNITSKRDFFKDKPFVGFTETSEQFRKEGLGERRILMMGAYAHMQYGLPLYSDTLIQLPAEKVWNKLVEKGRAEELREGDKRRYKLLVPRP